MTGAGLPGETPAGEGALIRQVADLLREAGTAHHRAFAATDGEDPEWPLWYAGYLQEHLEGLLGVRLTKSAIVHLLLAAEEARGAQAPGADWPAFYAAFLIARLRRA